MRFPTVHLNGTSKKELIEQYDKAIYDLNQAIQSLMAAAPHRRDYYPQGDFAFSEASQQFRAQVTSLCGVRDELVKIYEHLHGLER